MIISDASLLLNCLGLLVAVLAILVTALIGWQIWQLIDLHKYKHEIEIAVEKNNHESVGKAFIGLMQQSRFKLDNEDSDFYNSIANGLYAIGHLYLSKEPQNTYTTIADDLCEIIDRNLEIKRVRVYELNIILGQIKDWGVPKEIISRLEAKIKNLDKVIL